MPGILGGLIGSLYSKLHSSIVGYIAGGWLGSSSTAQINKFPYSTETVSTLASELGININDGAGFSSSTSGYHAGGYSSARSSQIRKVLFSNDSVSLSGTTLSIAPNGNRGVFNSTVAYSMGGATASGYVTTIDKIQLSNDSRSTLGTGLSSARGDTADIQTVSDFYAIGGYSNAANSACDKFSFSNETRSSFVTGTTDQVAMGISVNSSFGYSARVLPTNTEIDKWNLSTQTRSYTGQVLTGIFWGISGLNGVTSGYIAAGQGTNNVIQNRIYEQTFATDTVSLLAATLNTARRATTTFETLGS